MPAIMSGWLERVFTENFSFNFEEGKILDNGLLKVSVKILMLIFFYITKCMSVKVLCTYAIDIFFRTRKQC